MPYVDENGEELSQYSSGWLDGQSETLDLLIYALGDSVRAGSLTLTLAVSIFTEASNMKRDSAEAFICEYWAELMSARWSDMGDTTTE